MSILIKGMKKPESCEECPLYTCMYHYVDCPITELPPHGPLVDANRLINIALHLMRTAKNDNVASGVKWMWHYILEAPTIIEAEKGE